MKTKLIKLCMLLCLLCIGGGNVWGAENDSHDFSQSLSQLLNNSASISSITIPAQDYSVKEVKVTWSHNKNISNAVTIAVSVGGTSYGSANVTNGSSKVASFKTSPQSSNKGEISITFTNNCGNGTGKGTFSVSNVTLVEGAPSASHTVNFSINGSIETANSITVDEGDPITFPTVPVEDGIVFVGWTQTAGYSNATTAPTDLCKSATMGNADVTYYAVFATADGDSDDGWIEIFAAPTAGTYAICSASYFMKAAISSNRFANGSATPQIADGKLTVDPASDCIWEISKPDAYYRIQHSEKFAAGTNSKNQGALIEDASDDLAKWEISFIENHFDIINYGRSIATSDSGNKYLSNNTTYGWATYQSKACDSPRLFKKVVATYSDYCTIVSLDPKPSIVLSATELAEYAGNANTTITASISEEAYSGVLAVESSNEAVATASISEGTITINAFTAGTATITVTAPAVTGFRKNTATIAVTVNEKLAHGLSFSADALNLTVGDTEFGEPTLSNPNSLPVVYSLVYATPANEGKVATIDAETGKITLTGLSTETQGDVTVKASTVGDNSHAAGEVTYNLVVARKVTTTSWSNEGAAVTIDKDEVTTLPTASNNGERNLFYDSSNTGVATIDNAGAVTFVDYGTTTITAKTTATAEYAATSATYELTFAPRYSVTFSINGEETVLREETTGAGVTAPAVENINGMVFRGWAEATIDGTADIAPAFVTATSLDGDKILYAVFANKTVGSDGSVEFDVNSLVGIEVSAKSITQTSNNINFTFSSVQKTSNNGTEVQMAKSSTLTQDKAFEGAIKSIQFKGFKYSSTSNASMLVEGKKGADGTYTTVQSCGSTYKGAEIDFSNNDYDFFKISVGSGRTVIFTKMTVNYSGVTYYDFCTTVPTSAEIAISAAKYTTYYNSAVAYKMPEDCEGYVFTAANGLELAYEAKEVVPAGEPLVIYCNTEVTTTKTLNFTTSTENTYKSVEKNDLEGTDVKTSLTPDDNSYFYALTLNKANELNSVGFYWMNSTGAAFTNGAHKAYLKLPKSSNVKGFAFKDLTDAIQKVETEKNNGIIYNVAGQRVGKATKGLYIKDGRKFIVK